MIESIINNTLLLAIASATAYNTYLTLQTKEIALKTEVNTNSMKDALVLSTAKASRLEGRAEVRAENAR